MRDEVWAQIGMDLVGPLPETPNGHQYIMTITDYYTKWAEAVPLKDKSSLSVANALYSVRIISYVGIRITLHDS